MLKFINFGFSYAIIQSFAIFTSIAIFALITKKYYISINLNKYNRILYYGIVGAFFGMWSFFTYDNIPFISLGLFRTLGMSIIMILYASVVISPFVFIAYRIKKKEKELKTINDIPSSLTGTSSLDKDINNKIIYCLDCEREIKNTDKFCQYCGKKTVN